MTPPKSSFDDPSFASAVEKAYLAQVEKLEPDSGNSELTTHYEILDQAVFAADKTSGGLRFKKLAGARDLEDRLLRALVRRLRPKQPDT